jgi:hemoglobin-like flavoprotein
MTPKQKSLIRETWKQVVPIAEIAASLFYKRLFELDPDIRALFEHTDMDAQHARLISSLSAVVGALDEVETIVPLLSELGQRHAGYGVEDRHYETVGDALIWTLRQGLGERWSLAAENAWAAAYTLVSGVMREAANEQHAAAMTA